jgi:hypothetical protein
MNSVAHTVFTSRRDEGDGDVDEIRDARLLLIIGVVVLYAVGVTSMASAVPTPWSPYPMLQFGLVSTGMPRLATLLVVPLLFAVWNALALLRPYRGKFRGVGVAGGLLTIAGIAYLLLRGETGYVHQGVIYTRAVIAINLGLLLTFWCGWWAARKRPTSRNALLLGLVLFIWLAWCAFPYFGDVV